MPAPRVSDGIEHEAMCGGKLRLTLFGVLRQYDRLRTDILAKDDRESDHCSFMMLGRNHRPEANGTGEEAGDECQGSCGSAEQGQEVHDGLGLLV
ncbi:hypothetical protein R3X27_18050 [Tropicimonas sp. TH_r6]|uniref:hypothetical protein n=1 Tax=Tropicimonas sp. TH_r6 TaxID=3082085 RepID=UPI002952CA28|nr:hypothetical protein [Tropicimonas sp. TH_r6]MDV7144585.1 hypothetical protein [Tropicimonas sp. TH_r6]